MYDLTHPVETGMQTYPGDPSVSVEAVATYSEDGYRQSRLSCGSHTGTHVDAPAHVERDGRRLEAFEIDSFVMRCHRIDCRDIAARDSIGVDRIPTVDSDIDCLVVWTGWDDHWGTDRYLDHPSLTPRAARSCARQDLALALDTLNPDPTPSPATVTGDPVEFPAHHAILGAGQLIVENLCNLEAVDDRFELRAYPLSLAEDGAPVRAVGVC
ncbi:MAG: cyclase family protein [archaeon]